MIILALVLLALEALAFQAAFAADQNETSSASSLIFTPADIIRLVSFIFLFLGVLLRTVWPYVSKLKNNGGDLIWNHKYTLTAISALFVAFVTTMLAMPLLTIPTNIESLFAIALFCFGYGWGLNDMINQVSSGTEPSPTEPQTSEASSPAPTEPAATPEWGFLEGGIDFKIEQNALGQVRLVLLAHKYIKGDDYEKGFTKMFESEEEAWNWVHGKG